MIRKSHALTPRTDRTNETKDCHFPSFLPASSASPIHTHKRARLFEPQFGRGFHSGVQPGGLSHNSAAASTWGFSQLVARGMARSAV